MLFYTPEPACISKNMFAGIADDEKKNNEDYICITGLAFYPNTNIEIHFNISPEKISKKGAINRLPVINFHTILNCKNHFALRG
jgi:hypothetical protein